MTESPPVLSVSALTAILKEAVESTFPRVWVAGEVSNVTRASSGHVYFTLKDDGAQIKAVMWRSAAQRLKFEWGDGMQVIAAGALEVYPARGHYQLIVDRLQPQGMGALELALRQLQEKLAAEGLFNPERKRPLPTFPRQVALITSPRGAAVRDLIQVMVRRWPAIRIVVIPVPVQGAEAAPAIVEAFAKLPRFPEVDVVITGRGGGSLEDLWAFNEEPVARAIAGSPVPVVSAVGHETDVTIADLVADRRALTPSEAAELVAPSIAELTTELKTLERRAATAVRRHLVLAKRELDSLAQRRCLGRPFDRIRELAMQLDEWSQRLPTLIRRRFARAEQDLARISASLQALSPLAVLGRGYTLTKRREDGQIVKSAGDVSEGQELSTLVVDGVILSRCERIIRD